MRVGRSVRMPKKLFVGNLSWSLTEDELANAAGRFGTVLSARIITDRETGRSRGFGFIEVDDASAQAVIDGLNGFELLGRPVSVSEAREREDRSGNRGGGFRRAGRF